MSASWPGSIQRLELALRRPLPGDVVKHAFWPQKLRRYPTPTDLERSRRAAVLVALHAVDDDLTLLLLRRACVAGDVHSGQLALPGGGLEAGESVEQAALREAEEELGIAADRVRILGRLSDHWIPVSSYLVSPVVGWIAELPTLVPDPSEVDCVFHQPIAALKSPALRSSFEREFAGELQEIPCWKLADGELWGATAMILAELLAVWD